jgi:hypothetical protein
MTNKKEIEIFVDTVNENKLNEYVEVGGDTIKRFDHFFYSQNKYQEEGRKLVYGVCSSATKGRLTVNGYVPKGQEPEHDPWVIDVNNKYKEYRFYIKPNQTKKVAGKSGTSKSTKPIPEEEEEEEVTLSEPVKPVRPKPTKVTRSLKTKA